jgi:selenocysteine-specific elongation factor
MTIDLGFAWMTLPSGREVSIVDVPGHERFIKNMLAGVGGVDLAMLVVAADESVMPQTREHLAILDILQVRRGLVVITKTDLVEEELVELVKAEVEEVLKGTSFQGCPMVAVSSYTGAGLDALRDVLDRILDQTEVRPDLGRPRLPVDRCFTVSGFGTVVTGTLIDGVLAVGQEVELVTSGQRCRIRGLQSHQTKVDHANPGVRLAVNLSGITRGEIQRGEVLTTPGWLRPSRRLDVLLKMAPSAPRPLRHNEGVTFHLFTSESAARVRLLDADQLAPGAEGWVQIHLADPLPLVKGDFFVLRSAEDTLGGGQVVDPASRQRHRRFVPEVVEKLMMMHQGTGEDTLLSLADQWGPCDLVTLSRHANLPEVEVRERITQLAKEGQVVVLGTPPQAPWEKGGQGEFEADAVVYSSQGWNILKSKVFVVLQTYHRQYPLRRGAPSQEIRSRLGLSQPVYLKILARLIAEGYLMEEGQFLRLPEHQVSLTPEMERQATAYLQALEQEPYAPPTDQPLDPELLGVLIDQGKAVKVNESVVFAASAYREMTDKIIERIRTNGSVTVAEARTMFNTSRKYILPLLEYLDQQRITRRVGDDRVLR